MTGTWKLKGERKLEILFAVFVLGIWVFWAYILPFNEGPDEHMRSLIVKYIVEYGKLPTGYQQEILDPLWGFTYGFRPILPQMAEALLVRIALVFTRDAFALLFAGRMASVLCGLVYLIYVRGISRRLFERRSLAWLFTLAAVCMPGVSFLFTYLNCDSMALMAASMFLYYLMRGTEDGFSIPVCVKLAVSLSVCVLSYYNAYGFLITSVLVFAGVFWERRRQGETCGAEFWKKGFLILGIVLLLAGWWFVRNYILYDGDFLGLRTQELCAEQYAADRLKPSNRQTYRNLGLSLWDMLVHSNWVYCVAQSFIGVLGPLWYMLNKWVYIGYGLFFLAGWAQSAVELLGWLGKIFRKEAGTDRARLLWHLGMLTAVLVPNVLNFWYSYATDYQAQGRYSMPMLLPFLYYTVQGLGNFISMAERKWGEKAHRAAGLAVRCLCGAICAVLLGCLTHVMWPAYKNVENKMDGVVYTEEEIRDRLNGVI